MRALSFLKLARAAFRVGGTQRELGCRHEPRPARPFNSTSRDPAQGPCGVCRNARGLSEQRSLIGNRRLSQRARLSPPAVLTAELKRKWLRTWVGSYEEDLRLDRGGITCFAGVWACADAYAITAQYPGPHSNSVYASVHCERAPCHHSSHAERPRADEHGAQQCAKSDQTTTRGRVKAWSSSSSRTAPDFTCFAVILLPSKIAYLRSRYSIQKQCFQPVGIRWRTSANRKIKKSRWFLRPVWCRPGLHGSWSFRRQAGPMFGPS